MRTAAAIFAMLVDLCIAIPAAAAALTATELGVWRMFFAAGATAFGLLAAALVVHIRRKTRSRLWYIAVNVCWVIPALWLVGSLDHGVVSGLEILSIIAISVVAAINFLALKSQVPSHA